jgi:L-glutamine-phosphate cytidylyltransferase
MFPRQNEHTAVILAAGMGSRLWPLTRYTPKSLIDLGDGFSILDKQLDILPASALVSRVVVVTGHLADEIEHRVAASGTNTTTVFNPFFEKYGPLASLWMAREELDRGPVIVVNGDTILAPQLLDTLSQSTVRDAQLIVSRPDDLADDDVRVIVEGGRVRGVGKLLSSARLRSAGVLALTSSRARRCATGVLERLLRSPDHIAPGAPWHELVNALVAAGVDVTALQVDDDLWVEVDLHVDMAAWRSSTLEQLGRFRTAPGPGRAPLVDEAGPIVGAVPGRT